MMNTQHISNVLIIDGFAQVKYSQLDFSKTIFYSSTKRKSTKTNRQITEMIKIVWQNNAMFYSRSNGFRILWL